MNLKPIHKAHLAAFYVNGGQYVEFPKDFGYKFVVVQIIYYIYSDGHTIYRMTNNAKTIISFEMHYLHIIDIIWFDEI